MLRTTRSALIAAVLLVALSVAPAFAAGAAEEEPTEIRMPREPRQYISPLGQETAQQVLELPFSEVVIPGTNQVIVEYRLTIFDEAGDTVFEVRDIEEERRGFFGNLFGAEKPSVPLPDTLVWDGTYRGSELGPDGEVVPDGDYAYYVTVIDYDGNVAITPAFNVTVDNTLPEVTSLEAEYYAFAPIEGSGRAELIVRQEASAELEWEGLITDADGEPVWREVWANPTPRQRANDAAPPTEVRWDGTYQLDGDERTGEPAPEGEYQYSLIGRDRAGNEVVSELPRPVELSRTAAEVEFHLGDQEPAFSPVDTGIQDTLQFYTRLLVTDGLESWSVEVAATGDPDTVLRSMEGGAELPETVEFDGRDNAGNRMPDGEYQARLTAEYDTGYVAVSDALVFEIDTVPPSAEVTVDTLPMPTEPGDPLWFGGEQKHSLSLTIDADDDADWDAIVYFEGRRQLRVSAEEFGIMRFPLELEWDGHDLDGSELPDGEYSAYIEGVDRAGNIGQSDEVGAIKDTRPASVELELGEPDQDTSDGVDLVVADEERESVPMRLSYEPEDGIREIIIEVRDSDGEIVRSIRSDPPLESWAWFGEDNAGRRVDDGDYYVDARVIYYNGNEPEATEIGPIRVDATPPISDVPPEISISAAPIPFAPDDYQQHELTFTLEAETENEFDRWELEILEPNSPSFITFSGEGRPDRELVWDGRNDDGDLVQAAVSYTAVFRVWDNQGLMSETELEVPIDILVMQDGDLWRISIPSIQFPPNTANLFGLDWDTIEENFRVLRRLAEVLRRFNSRSIIIEGHAAHVFYDESDPRHQREQDQTLIPLSRRRAEEVRRALIILGFDRNKMSTVGVGGERPTVPHSNREEVWKNRRVEFILDVE